MSGPGTVRTQVFNAREHSHLTVYLAGIHGECITSDKMIGTFVSPLNIEKMLKWWKDRIAETTAGNRVIIMLLSGAPDPAVKIHSDHLVGVAMLATPHVETSPFRASVESLLISSRYRRRGGSHVLLQAVEDQALMKGKTLLMAEMESGTTAEALFKKHAYQEAGMVPRYSLRPDNGDRRDAVFLYKDLSP
ncbi:hypothetical protein N0V82_005843 [Gnomoniopsis sp. IMI 355080]|nr:hypothetical protein N0V82_005843 [Gnomoniopsis sp. IMI 355080]